MPTDVFTPEQQSLMAALPSKAPRQADVLTALRNAPADTPILLADFPAATVKALSSKGLVLVEDAIIERDPHADDTTSLLPSQPLVLNNDQLQAVLRAAGEVAVDEADLGVDQHGAATLLAADEIGQATAAAELIRLL